MSETYFIADLHLAHKSILKFSGNYRRSKNVDEHDIWVINQINKIVTSKDKLFILGDICFNGSKLDLINQIKTDNLHLVLGNHDKFHIDTYRKYFKSISGDMKYKGYWVTHIPIHPQELYGSKNIHGHCHQNYIKDERYINVSVETNHAMPVSFESIVTGRHYKNYTSYIDLVEGAKK